MPDLQPPTFPPHLVEAIAECDAERVRRDAERKAKRAARIPEQRRADWCEWYADAEMQDADGGRRKTTYPATWDEPGGLTDYGTGIYEGALTEAEALYDAACALWRATPGDADDRRCAVAEHFPDHDLADAVQDYFEILGDMP